MIILRVIIGTIDQFEGYHHCTAGTVNRNSNVADDFPIDSAVLVTHRYVDGIESILTRIPGNVLGS